MTNSRSPMTETPLAKFKQVRYAKEWWRLRKKYSRLGPIWVAKSSADGPSPVKIDHLFSMVLFNYGERYFAFSSEAARDGFVEEWASAEAVEDPIAL